MGFFRGGVQTLLVHSSTVFMCQNWSCEGKICGNHRQLVTKKNACQLQGCKVFKTCMAISVRMEGEKKNGGPRTPYVDSLFLRQHFLKLTTFFYHAQIIKCFCPQGTWKGLPFFTRKVLYFTSITVHNNCAVLGRIARESNLWHHDSCYQQAIACFTSCYPLQWDFKQVSNTEVGTCSANHLKIKT